MVAHSRAHPRDACVLGLRDGGHGGKAHDEMAHGVVAIDERGARALLYQANIRARLDTSCLEAPQIERKANHAVGIAAAQIGLDHQAGDNLGVFRGKPGSLEGALDESG